MSRSPQDPAREAPVLLSVAFPYAPVGPQAVGGAEVVCTLLEESLPELGYTSVVVAHAESTPAGHLYGTVLPSGQITESVRAEVEARHQANIDRALREHRVALVHMHGLDFHRYRIPERIPVLVTLHLPPAWYPESLWNLGEQYRFVCVSETQRRACPREVQDRLTVVNNGVPLPPRDMLRASGRYALLLARICEEKNLHVGLDAARKAGLPALLGGDVFPYEAHQRYFQQQIQPRLTAKAAGHESRAGAGLPDAPARFLGPVTREDKQRLLTRAACLLLPSLAPETSSLVAMEALAAGVPVIGIAVGAVPEIVSDGTTGFLIEPGERAAERMAAAIERLPLLDRQSCRAEAEARFPVGRMVEGYQALYRHVLASRATSPERRKSDEAPAEDFKPLTVDELTSSAALAGLVLAWERLWAADCGTTPFQHPAWLLPWWRQFGPDGELHSLAVWETPGRLAGLLPLYRFRPAPEAERQLLLVGAGTTDYLDGIWGVRANEAARCALHYARQSLPGWDVASLDQVRASSPLAAAAAASEEWTSQAAESCSSLRLAQPLPAKVRVNLRRYRRLAEQQGELCSELAATADEALAAFDALVAFHGARWRERGEKGVLHDSRVLAHHREALPALLTAGLLRMFRLQLSGETVAVLYGLADGAHVAERRLYLYLIGFAAKASAYSPGSLLMLEAWKHAQTHGFACVDLLRGGEAYKRFWGAENEPTLNLHTRPAAR